LAKQGLTDREAFGSAVRQMGSPRELAREFARENPLPVWRERFLWMILACFVVSVWGWMTGGVLLWFVNVFGVLLPLSGMAWLQMAGNVPVLAVAVLLATGRLERLTGRLAWILQSRQRLGLAGAAFLLASMVVRLFGPSPLQLPKNSLMGLLYLLSASAGGGSCSCCHLASFCCDLPQQANQHVRFRPGRLRRRPFGASAYSGWRSAVWPSASGNA